LVLNVLSAPLPSKSSTGRFFKGVEP
jgi:hypothetical protein